MWRLDFEFTFFLSHPNNWLIIIKVMKWEIFNRHLVSKSISIIIGKLHLHTIIWCFTILPINTEIFFFFFAYLAVIEKERIPTPIIITPFSPLPVIFINLNFKNVCAIVFAFLYVAFVSDHKRLCFFILFLLTF